jgi:uncharacterized RDD family membrane protein YckC
LRNATTPSLLRRFAAMLYEAVLLFAVAFVATSLFQFAAGDTITAGSWQRHALQAYLLLMFAAYFLWCWLRGGQTLAMKAWVMRNPPLALATFAVCGSGLGWALFDRDRQFLHDRLAGSRLVMVEEERT